MTPPARVLFLCPHGAAKSVIAAAYFEREAARRGLSLSAAAAGTDPDPHVSPAAVNVLLAEGLDLSGYRPRRVTAADMEDAWRVISLGCAETDLPSAGVPVEHWHGIPAVSEDPMAACVIIRQHVERLIDELDRAITLTSGQCWRGF